MSMKIMKKNTDANTIVLSGRLDNSTAPELEKELDEILATASKLVLDMENLEYISSAGLRVILKTQKALAKREGLKLLHVPDTVREVFDITGFTEFLTLE